MSELREPLKQTELLLQQLVGVFGFLPAVGCSFHTFQSSLLGSAGCFFWLFLTPRLHVWYPSCGGRKCKCSNELQITWRNVSQGSEKGMSTFRAHLLFLLLITLKHEVALQERRIKVKTPPVLFVPPCTVTLPLLSINRIISSGS